MRTRRAAHYRPIATAAASYEHVLVLGDAAAAEELLRNRAAKDVDFVTPEKQFVWTVSARLHRYTEDPFRFLATREKHYDFILVALAAPKTEAENRAYTNLFYRMCANHLNEGGTLAVETVSPNAFPAAYRCLALTMESEGLIVQRLTLPEGGDEESGVLFAARQAGSPVLPAGTLLQRVKEPTGAEIPPVGVNRLNRPLLLNYLEEKEKTK
nr:hypothetical protein [uncultured Stomatobaculum sp.]